MKEAAARELREETGLDVPIGPCLWIRELVWYWAEHRAWTRSVERFFVARTLLPELATGGWTEAERRVVTEWRWWTAAELLETADTVVPRRLGELLPDVAAGRLPEAPLVITE